MGKSYKYYAFTPLAFTIAGCHTPTVLDWLILCARCIALDPFSRRFVMGLAVRDVLLGDTAHKWILCKHTSGDIQ